MTMHAPRIVSLVLTNFILIGGCSTSTPPLMRIEPIRHATGMADAQVAARYISTPRPERFSVCHEHTCHEISEISLQPEVWTDALQAFSTPAPDAVAEREQIKTAIAALERTVGNETGTNADQGRPVSCQGFCFV